jgi:hypothetical protein
MGKIRRGGFIFVTWIGDHRGGAKHVHVFRDSRLVLKWDLDNEKALEGRPTSRVLELIGQLRKEGRI